MLLFSPISSILSVSASIYKAHGCSNGLFSIHGSRIDFQLLSSTSNIGLRSPFRSRKSKASESVSAATDEEEEEDYQVLTAVRSMYNEIMVVDSPKSRMLLLDSTRTIHSISNKSGEKWTGSYWDEFVALPAIIPEGPIAIYGLGAGTVAHLMLDVWPSLQLEGWEIDEILIDKARTYFGLSELEEQTEAGGRLEVRIGDAFSAAQSTSEGYAGIVIDLFSKGEVLEQLQQVYTWLELKKKLMPDGRFMVNCGGKPDNQIQNSTIKAMAAAFHGHLNWKELQGNYLALTGPLPDTASWSATVPERISENVKQWRSY